MFKDIQFSKVYQQYMMPVPQNVSDLKLRYLQEKGGPFELAVDVGCGTGRSTRPLAPYFHKVIGIDISETQINEARKHTSEENVSYLVSPAEDLPLEDSSVDLVNAGMAAHWFPMDKFLKEADRVLKPRGCIALHAFKLEFAIQYKEKSEELTRIICDAFEVLYQHGNKSNNIMRTQYKEIYEAIPYPDRQRITDIPVTFPLPVAEVLGFLQAIYMYQEFMRKDKDGAKAFLQNVEKRFLDTLGEPTDGVLLGLVLKFYCILACKP
ncbi:putative methyltransferase isoform 1-T2 [Discoglossus pictus]